MLTNCFRSLAMQRWWQRWESVQTSAWTWWRREVMPLMRRSRQLSASVWCTRRAPELAGTSLLFHFLHQRSCGQICCSFSVSSFARAHWAVTGQIRHYVSTQRSGMLCTKDHMTPTAHLPLLSEAWKNRPMIPVLHAHFHFPLWMSGGHICRSPSDKKMWNALCRRKAPIERRLVVVHVEATP